MKKKTNLGARRLSKLLGLKSRGAIEGYSFMRTAPPVDIVKELEKISGVKANYEEIEGKVYRKKREFIPLDPRKAEKKLKEKFKGDFEYLDKLIKTKLTIKDITSRVRKKGYTFDNAKISLCIGAYRTNLLSKIVKEIEPTKREIIIHGHIRKDRKTLSINFNLMPLYKILKENQICVGLEISKDRNKIRISRLDFGRKLISSNRAIKILLTEKSRLNIKSNVEIVLNPREFGFSIGESIYDNDAKVLVKEAIKEGFELDQQRSTPANHKGDLSLYLKDKNIIIEITRASSYKGSYFKIGQCFVQKISWPKTIQFLICKNQFLSKDSEKALKKLNVKIINVNFNKGWEKECIEKVKNGIK